MFIRYPVVSRFVSVAMVFLSTLLLISACGGGRGSTTVISPVAVSGVFPSEARAGEEIVIRGQHFGSSQGSSTLKINGVPVTQIVTWTDTQIEAYIPTGATTGNVIVTVDGVDGAPGHLVVMWQSRNPLNAAVSIAANDQRRPAQIPDDLGGSIIAWGDLRDGSFNVYAQRLNHAGQPRWSLNGVALGVAGAGTAIELVGPKIVSDGTGGAIVVWSDQRSGNLQVYAQRLNADGVAQWATGGVRVSNADNSQIKPQLIADGSGGVIVAWYNLGTPSGTYAQRLNGAGVAHWAAEGVMVGPQFDQLSFHDLAMVSDGAGGAIIAAVVNNNNGSFVQRINAAGAVVWLAGGVTLGQGTTAPKLIPDGAGGVIALVHDSASRSMSAQRLDSMGSKQWGANGLVVRASDSTGFPVSPTTAAVSPALVSDGNGGAIIAWRLGSGGNQTLEAQRINGAGILQWTDAQMNPAPVVISATASAKSNPQMLLDRAGGAYMVWSDARSGENDLYIQRLNANGGLLWSTATVVSTAAGNQIEPQLTSDNTGGTIVVWADSRNGNYDIFAQRINASGQQ